MLQTSVVNFIGWHTETKYKPEISLVILPDYHGELKKPLIKNFGLYLRKIFIIFLKKSTKNENFMIFQRAVRKYVGIYEKS